MSTETTQEGDEARKCGDLKRGNIDLRCVLLPGHAEGPDATWHAATCIEHRTIEYDGARHEIYIRETVTWEPVDHVREAVRHLKAGGLTAAELLLLMAASSAAPEGDAEVCPGGC